MTSVSSGAFSMRAKARANAPLPPVRRAASVKGSGKATSLFEAGNPPPAGGGRQVKAVDRLGVTPHVPQAFSQAVDSDRAPSAACAAARRAIGTR